jgi:hypothetical protein
MARYVLDAGTVRRKKEAERAVALRAELPLRPSWSHLEEPGRKPGSKAPAWLFTLEYRLA